MALKEKKKFLKRACKYMFGRMFKWEQLMSQLGGAGIYR